MSIKCSNSISNISRFNKYNYIWTCLIPITYFYSRNCRAVVGGTFWTDTEVWFLKLHILSFHFHYFIIFSVFNIIFLLSNRNKIEKLLYLDFHNPIDNLHLKQVSTEFCASRERRQCGLGPLKIYISSIVLLIWIYLHVGSWIKHFPKLLKVVLMLFDCVGPLLQRVSFVYFCLLKYRHVVWI